MRMRCRMRWLAAVMVGLAIVAGSAAAVAAAGPATSPSDGAIGGRRAAAVAVASPSADDTAAAAASSAPTRRTPRQLLQRQRCDVRECKTCERGNSARCSVCEEYAYLIVSTGQCECKPGTAGKRSCRPCSGDSISPGGPMPTPTCTRCPTGLVPNPEKSECVEPSAWKHWGGDLGNRRWTQVETRLNAATAGQLRVKWEASVVGSTSATPTVHDGFVFVPDWEGYMHCLDAETGNVVWSRQIKDYLSSIGVTLPDNLNVFPILSRTSPVVAPDNLVVIGTMRGSFGGFAYFLGIDRRNGDLRWSTLADPNIATVVTTSPTLYNGILYGGVSSLEENLAASPPYECCTFRGSVLAINSRTGYVQWRTYTTPENGGQPGGWSGAAVWGSSPLIDRVRKQVVVATGDNYSMPDEVEECLLALGELNADNAAEQTACLQLAGGENNAHNAVMAFDLDTGRVKWSTPVDGPDAWNAACLSDNPNVNDNCLAVEGPDFDFGQAPMLVTPCKGGRGCRQLYVVGQKSGIVWAVDPVDGSVVWKQRAGPGGVIGGIMWGSASDGQTIYTNNNNFFHSTLMLKTTDRYLRAVPNTPGASSAPANATGGLLVALSAFDGAIRWTFTNPATDRTGFNAWSLNPVTLVGQGSGAVVLTASMDPAGKMFALKASNGKLLGTYELGASSACGPSVVDGVVYTGTGYSNFGLGAAGTKVVALEAPEPPPEEDRRRSRVATRGL